MNDAVHLSFDIVHVTSAHPVGDTRIFVKEARSLARAGYRVAVLGPGDEVGQWLDDSGVVQFTLPRPRNRAVRFCSFGTSLLRAALDLQPGVVHLHDPDLLRLRSRFQAAGVAVVYDMHEDFPKAILSRTWLGPRMLRQAVSWCSQRLESRALERVDGVVLADRQLMQRLPACAPPNVLARNYLQTSEWPEIQPESAADPLRLVYVGDLTKARGALRMCDVVVAGRNAGMNLTLDLIGPCPDQLREQVMLHPAAKCITMHGKLGRPDVVQVLARSDVGFCLFEPTPAYREGLPVKLFEYMISGLSVVGTRLPRMQSETPLAEGMFLIDWQAESAEIVSALHAAGELSDLTRRRLQQRVREQYNWLSEEQALLSLYEKLLPL